MTETPLTESTFYVLMALYEKDTFGTEIVAFIKEKSENTVKMGPGTLYSILAKFEKDKWIKEIAVEGRKRTYSITPLGIQCFENELDRLERLTSIAKSVREKHHEV